MLAAPAGAGGEGRAEDEGQRDGERDRGGVGHGEESVEGERKRDHEDAQVGVLRLEEGDGTRLDLRRASRRGGERVMGSGGGRVRCSVVERGDGPGGGAVAHVARGGDARGARRKGDGDVLGPGRGEG